MLFLVELLDYGLKELIDLNDIFRPMIKYLHIGCLSFKLKIKNELKNNND